MGNMPCMCCCRSCPCTIWRGAGRCVCVVFLPVLLWRTTCGETEWWLERYIPFIHTIHTNYEWAIWSTNVLELTSFAYALYRQYDIPGLTKSQYDQSSICCDYGPQLWFRTFDYVCTIIVLVRASLHAKLAHAFGLNNDHRVFMLCFTGNKWIFLL